jgi:hypothetical protein
MKRYLALLILIFVIVSSIKAQQRWKVSQGTTGTSVDTVYFGIPYWGLYVENQGEFSDTLWVWQITSPGVNDKIMLTGGEGFYFPSSAPNYYVFLKSNGNVKRRVIVTY